MTLLNLFSNFEQVKQRHFREDCRAAQYANCVSLRNGIVFSGPFLVSRTGDVG